MTERDTELMYAGISAARVTEPLRICETCPARLSPTNRKGQCRRCQARQVPGPLRGAELVAVTPPKSKIEIDLSPKTISISAIPFGASAYANRGAMSGLWKTLCELSPGDALEIPCRDATHRSNTKGNLKQVAYRHNATVSTRSLGNTLYAWLERGGASAR